MKQWEYKVDIWIQSKMDTIESVLNELGREGWEVFRVDTSDSSFEDQDSSSGYRYTATETTYKIWLKREKEEIKNYPMGMGFKD